MLTQSKSSPWFPHPHPLTQQSSHAIAFNRGRQTENQNPSENDETIMDVCEPRQE